MLIERAEENPKIVFHPNREIVEIVGETATESLLLRDTANGAIERLPVAGLFVAIGHRPNSTLFAGLLSADAHGYLRFAGDGTTAATVEGVFLAGDVHDHRYRQAVTAAGDGARAAIDAERYLSLRRR